MWSAPARAQEALEEANNPIALDLLLGPSIFLTACNDGGCIDGSATQFKLQQVFGYHVSGDGEGFAIGLALQEAFGQGFFRFQPGMRLWGDIRVADDYTIFISPYGHLGYGLFTVAVAGLSGEAHTFNWALGVGVKAVLFDAFSIGFNPVGFDFFVNDDAFTMFYDLSFSLGATF